MLRWITAGESHGPELIGVLEGLPAGVPVLAEDIQDALARRRLGYGRGARMKFEQDEISLSTGIRHGLSQGGPIAIRIANTEWPKWETVMSAAPVAAEDLTGARGAALTRPRPGHADFTGMQKYNFDDARPVLERASARETATRVALGQVAKNFLRELGIELVTHTVAIGPVQNTSLELPKPSDVEKLDTDPVRCFDKEASAQMVAEIDDCHSSGDTIGGVTETLVYGCPPGIGS
ncbi:MAG: chorismate synthase, partial [Actinomycetota bacterium]